MTRIAIIEDGFVRDTQIFTADPAIIEADPNWENHFTDAKYSCHYIGIFGGESEKDICLRVAKTEGVHPDVTTLIDIEVTSRG